MLLALVHRFSPPLLVSLDNNGENTGAIKTTVTVSYPIWVGNYMLFEIRMCLTPSCETKPKYSEGISQQGTDHLSDQCLIKNSIHYYFSAANLSKLITFENFKM